MAAPAPATGNSDVGTYVLLGIVILALYLVWKSVQNVGSTVSDLSTTAEGYASSVGATLASEGSSLLNLPGSALNSLGTIGTSLYSSASTMGSSIYTGLAGLFGDSSTDAGLSLGGAAAAADLGWADTSNPEGSSILGLSDPLSPVLGSPSLLPLPAEGSSSTYVNGDGNLPSSNSGGSLLDSSPGSFSSTNSGYYGLGSP